MEDRSSPPHQPHADLTLTPERWALIRPKLESLLAELSKMDELEGWEVEPDTVDAWGVTVAVGRSGEAGER